MATVKMVRAKEAIVITVGARPVEYRRVKAVSRRTGEVVEVEANEFPPIDEGDEGIPYAFKPDEKVRADHPAVKACPGAFVDDGDTE